jgi:hypothetical protein
MKILLADFNAGYLLCTKSTVQPNPIVIYVVPCHKRPQSESRPTSSIMTLWAENTEQPRPHYCGEGLLVEPCLWMFLDFLQGPKDDSSQSPEGLEVWTSQSFVGVRVNREGQRLLLLGDLSTDDWPVQRVELRILLLETCQDGINFGGITNANKHPGSLVEVLRVNNISAKSVTVCIHFMTLAKGSQWNEQQYTYTGQSYLTWH